MTGKRRIYRAGAALVATVGVAASLTLEHGPTLRALFLLWALHILVVGELVGSARLSSRIGGVVSSIGGIVFLPAIVVMTTDSIEGVLFPLLVAMPLVVAALAPDDRGSVLVFAVGGLGWAIWLELTAHQPWSHVALAAGMTTTYSVIALLATFAHQRARAAEVRATAERVAVLEQLALSERRRADAQRLVVLGELAAGVAHEINNPLTFVMGNLVMVRDHLQELEHMDDSSEKMLDRADEGLDRVRQIVSDLAKFSRRDSETEQQVCDACATVEEALRIASARLHGLASVASELPHARVLVGIGAGRLVQVLVNLLVNAADALESRPGGGHVRVYLPRPPSPSGRVRLAIEDNGPGLPADVIDKLFDPFFTTKVPGKGTGLGLALCRKYVEAVGGSIRAENCEAGGARFILDLPAVVVDEAQPPPPDVASAAADSPD